MDATSTTSAQAYSAVNSCPFTAAVSAGALCSDWVSPVCVICITALKVLLPAKTLSRVLGTGASTDQYYTVNKPVFMKTESIAGL